MSLPEMVELKKRHDQLFADFKERLLLLQRDKPERDCFLQSVKSLVDNLKEMSRNNNDVADFYWMINAVSTWQLITSNVLGESTSPSVIEPPRTLVSMEDIRFDEREVTKIISDKAYRIAEWRRNERRIEKLIKVLGEDVPLSDMEERNDDWFRAERYLAFDILKGEYDLAHFASETMFLSLGRVWLRDVLELASYTIWEDKKKRRYPSRYEDIKGDYGEAQLWFYECVLGQGHDGDVPPRITKTSSLKAESILIEYVGKHFLTAEGKIDIKKATCRKLIDRKAYRAWELSKEWPELKNWAYAEKYVTLFYNNIVNLVTKPSDEARSQVREAIEMSEDVRFHRSIIDCFEAAALMFFVKDITIDLSRVLSTPN